MKKEKNKAPVVESRVVLQAQLRAVPGEANDLEDNQAEFVISSEAVDSYGTVFRLDGWDLESYHKNPIVTYNHSLWSDDPDLIIGLSEVYRDGQELVGRVTFEEGNKVADKVKRKVNNGTLRMASVGARPTSWSWGDPERGEDEDVIYFDTAQLVEWSIVPAGANKDAHKRNEESLETFRLDLAKDLEVDDQEEVARTENKVGVTEALVLINKCKFHENK